MMMALGAFVFSLPTLAYQDTQHQTAWRHESLPSVGTRPVNQFIGAGEEVWTLTGALLPAFKGSPLAVEILRNMAHTGQAHSLVSGTGQFLGNFVITRLTENATLFYVNGTAHKIDFTLELKRDAVGIQG